jgi:hypothetical protein
VIVLGSVGIALAPGPVEDLGGVRNPLGLEGAPWVAYTAAVVPLLPLCVLASAVSLVLRYRRSAGEERQQVKWIAFTASFVGVVALITVVSTQMFAPESLETAGTQPLWLELLQDVELLSLAGVPVAVGFAILRHRLYDIDVVINRTLVYGSLTAMLVAVYYGSVVILQYIFRAERRGVAVCDSGIHAGYSRLVQPAAPPGAGVRGSTLLPPQVRCRQDPGRLWRPVARGDGSGDLGQRPGKGGARDDAASPRLAVVALRFDFGG